MPHIIAALFEDRGAAERALQALLEIGVTADQIALEGGTIGADPASLGGTPRPLGRDDRRAALDDLPLPADDVALFARGLDRGHVLLVARVAPGEMTRALPVLEMFEPVDLDRRSEAWMREAAPGADAGAPLGAGLSAGLASEGLTNTPALPGAGTLTDGTDDLGTADLRSGGRGREGQGGSNTVPTGGRRAEERAEAPGALALEGRADPGLVAKRTPMLDPETVRRGDAEPDLYRRETSRLGRVRAYSRD